jgi:hypothetical protein
MVYQLSEQNQILVALFAIVVLCAGKLFKDYLFRQGYVEGMLVTTETSTQLRRAATTGSTPTVAELYFYVTLERELAANETIILSWTGNEANNVTVGDTITAAVVSGTTSSSLTASGTGNSKTFTAQAIIRNGSKIKITVSSVSIFPGTADKTLEFTITPSNGEGAIMRSVRILSPLSSGTQFTSPYQGTSAEIQAAIADINTRLTNGSNISDTDRIALLKARSALVTLLASTYGTVKEAGQVFESDALYEAQRTAMEFIKNEKERATSNAESLKQDNLNKRRMAQINMYYTKNYEANTEVMKKIIIITVALIVLAVLRNKELIPSSLSTLGVILVLTFGGIVVGKQVFDIIRRNDHDFDKYDWNFNEDEMNRKQLLQQNSDSSNLLDMGMGMIPCYGPGCCDVGTSWNAGLKKCTPSLPGLSGTAAWTSGSAGGTLTLSLNVTNALAVSDTITITLPSGVFSGSSPTLSAGSAFSVPTGSSISTIAPFTLNVVTAINASANPSNIVITGLSVIASSDATRSKILRVKSTNDPNEVGIPITGIQ